MQGTRIGIVNLLERGGHREIRFGRPYFALIAMGLIGIGLVLLQCLILVNMKRNGIAAVSILLVPVALIVLHLRSVWTHGEHVELREGMIVCRSKDGDDKQIDIKTIQGITANENAPSFIDFACVPKRPAVVIVAETATATIRGPRKFTDAEAGFLLAILNKHRHGC